MSYGRKSNAALLQNYGFVLDSNPHDDFTFPDDADATPFAPSHTHTHTHTRDSASHEREREREDSAKERPRAKESA